MGRKMITRDIEWQIILFTRDDPRWWCPHCQLEAHKETTHCQHWGCSEAQCVWSWMVNLMRVGKGSHLPYCNGKNLYLEGSKGAYQDQMEGVDKRCQSSALSIKETHCILKANFSDSFAFFLFLGDKIWIELVHPRG